MPTTPEIKDDLHNSVGPDATSTFETGGNYVGSDPTASAGSESLYSAAAPQSARSTDDDVEDDDDAEDDDLEDDDDDLDEDDEDEDDDLEDDEDDDEDEDDEDLEDDDDSDEDDDDEEDDEEDDELSAESSDTIRGRNTANARTAVTR